MVLVLYSVHLISRYALNFGANLVLRFQITLGNDVSPLREALAPAAAVLNAGILFLKYIPTDVTVGLLVWIGVVITALAFDEDMHSCKAHGIAVVVRSWTGVRS